MKVEPFLTYIIEKESKHTDGKWITIKSKKKDKGRHVFIGKDGTIKHGLGNKFKDQKIDDIYNNEFDKNATTGIKAHKHAPLNINPENYLEEAALSRYTQEDYEEINDFLRTDDVKISPTIQNILGVMKEVMKRQKTTKDMIVYRGLSIEVKDINDLVIGDVIEDKGFTSTTTDMKTAKTFAYGNGLIMKIRVPKGSRAASMTSISAYPQEEEILIDNGGRYKVAEIDKEINMVTFELVQN